MIYLLLSFFVSVAHAHNVPDEHGHDVEDKSDQHYTEEEKKNFVEKASQHPQKILILGNYHKSSLLDQIPTVSTLEGDALLKRRATSLGETLKNEVGVNTTGYGPTASRPTIRGLDGDRIRILQNGIGVLDASGASQDHAVPVDPLTAEAIEIVRGPITLLYGSSAVGGVVNIRNSRIHEEVSEGMTGAVDAQGSSVNSGKALAAKIDYGIKNWMFHVDGSFNKTENVKVPGYVHSKYLREKAPTNPEPRDKMPNSASEINSVAAGATYITQKGYLGLSASTFNNHYGVVAEDNVMVKMEQQRYDVAGELRQVGWFKAARLKSALSVYKHTEVEDGISGTVFKNNGNETRIELVQNEWNDLTGVLGLQFNTFKFSALGEEAFLPKTDNLSTALFAFEEFNWNPVKWNFGARGEFSSVKPEADANFALTEKESFNTGSVSTGVLYNLTETISTALNLSYNERAPNYQELFSSGAHVATFTFQQGDPNLKKEKSLAAEWSLRHQSRFLTGSLNIFGQRFNDFIALSPTGAVDDTDESGVAGDSAEDLPIYNYLAQDANIYGAEMDLHFAISQDVLPGKWSIQVKGDYLRGKNRSSGDNLPRMSPPRASIGLNHQIKKWSWDAELQEVFRQSKLAPNETGTDSYLQTNLGLNYKMTSDQRQLMLFARANNIFDVEARNHISLLKDYAQIGGRNVVVGLRGYF